MTDSKTQLCGKKKSERNSSEETEEEKPKHESKQWKHVEFESQPDFFSDICFESDTVVAPDAKLEESEVAITSDNVSTESTFHPSSEESSDKVIPEDISLPSQFLLPT